MYDHTYSKSMDQPGKVANLARGQLNRENTYFHSPYLRLGIWSRETGSAVPSRVSLLISILRLDLVLTYGIPPEFRVIYFFKPPYAIGSVPSQSGQALRTDGVHCREPAGTEPVNLKVVPNECCLGRSPWTN